MRKNFIYCTIFLMAVGLVSNSCQKDQFQLDRLYDEIEIRTDLVAPLIFGSMGMGDLVAEFDSSGYVDEFDDGLIYLAYNDTVAEVMVDTLDLLPDGFYTQIYFDTEIAGDPFFLGSAVGDTVHFIKSSIIFHISDENGCLENIFERHSRLRKNGLEVFHDDFCLLLDIGLGILRNGSFDVGNLAGNKQQVAVHNCW